MSHLEDSDRSRPWFQTEQVTKSRTHSLFRWHLTKVIELFFFVFFSLTVLFRQPPERRALNMFVTTGKSILCANKCNFSTTALQLWTHILSRMERTHTHSHTAHCEMRQEQCLLSTRPLSSHTKPRSGDGSRKGWWELPDRMTSLSSSSCLRISLLFFLLLLLFSASFHSVTYLIWFIDDERVMTGIIRGVASWRAAAADRLGTVPEIHLDNLSIWHLVSARCFNKSSRWCLRLVTENHALSLRAELLRCFQPQKKNKKTNKKKSNPCSVIGENRSGCQNPF